MDEICLRLKSGVYDKQGHQFKPQLVRVGRSDVVNVAIKDLTLEELVDKRIGERNYEIRTDPELERKFNNAVTKRRELRGKLDSESGNPESPMSTEDISKLQLKIRELSKIINELGRDRDEMREKNSVNYRNRDLDRRNAQAHILAVSDIICSTLSGSAHDVLATMGIKFDTVIIDEACQCTELSSIIPLRYGGSVVLWLVILTNYHQLFFQVQQAILNTISHCSLEWRKIAPHTCWMFNTVCILPSVNSPLLNFIRDD